MPTLTQPQPQANGAEARTEAREILAELEQLQNNAELANEDRDEDRDWQLRQDGWTRIYTNKTPLVEKPEYVFDAWVVVGCIAAAAVIVALRLLGFGG